ncbi:MAG: CobW family GTP-binding protein [Acidobacteriota bacterium]
MAPEKIPVSLITGFLGSGKTTLLNALLRHPGMDETAVVVNEFGEIGIDHLLIETALDDAVLLKSGCVCCTMRGDLVDTLASLLERRGRGESPPFRRVVIETTGLADPAPVLHTLAADPETTRGYRLEHVLATVDAVNALDQLARHYESAKQAALADRLVLTKTDLASPQQADHVTARLAALNPTAPVVRAIDGDADPRLLFAPASVAERAAPAEVEAWLAAAGLRSHAHEADGSDHCHGIVSFCLVHDRPIAWPALKAWLEALASLRGSNLLRLKGIVDVAGWAGPVAIHAVQHILHPPRELARWPGQDRRSRVVCIVRDLPRAALERSFAALTADLRAP